MSSFLIATYELMLRLEICISSKNLCCDLKFSHHCYIHFYPGCDLDNLLHQENFQVSLKNSIHSNFNSPNPIKTNTIKFIFIIQIFNESIHYASDSKLKHKNKKNFPQLSIILYRRQNLNKFKKSILPLFVSFVDWKFDCRFSSFAHSYCPAKLKKNKNLLNLQAIMNKLHKAIKNFTQKE